MANITFNSLSLSQPASKSPTPDQQTTAGGDASRTPSAEKRTPSPSNPSLTAAFQKPPQQSPFSNPFGLTNSPAPPPPTSSFFDQLAQKPTGNNTMPLTNFGTPPTSTASSALSKPPGINNSLLVSLKFEFHLYYYFFLVSSLLNQSPLMQPPIFASPSPQLPPLTQIGTPDATGRNSATPFTMTTPQSLAQAPVQPPLSQPPLLSSVAPPLSMPPIQPTIPPPPISMSAGGGASSTAGSNPYAAKGKKISYD